MNQHSVRSPLTSPGERPQHAVGPSHAEGIDQGIRVLSYLIGGVLTYGLLGWLADHLLGTAFLLPVGIVFGAAAAVYVIIRRFGSDLTAVPSQRAPGQRPQADPKAGRR